MSADFLTIRQSSERLGVAYNTIRNAILAGRLPAYKILGTYRIKPEDLDAFVEGCRVEAGGRATAGPPAPRPTTLKHLDGERLRDAWIRQGVRPPRRGGRSAPSSGSSDGP